MWICWWKGSSEEGEGLYMPSWLRVPGRPAMMRENSRCWAQRRGKKVVEVRDGEGEDGPQRARKVGSALCAPCLTQTQGQPHQPSIGKGQWGNSAVDVSDLFRDVAASAFSTTNSYPKAPELTNVFLENCL